MTPNQSVVLLRLALALVWLWTGIVCLFVAPIGESLKLLDPVGIHGAAGRWTVWLTSGFEIVLGVALATGRFPRLMAAVQVAMICGFTLIITIFLPGWWLHPFGPISKNVVLIAAALAVERLGGSSTAGTAVSPERS